MSGINLLEWIRGQPECRDLPVVVFSAAEEGRQKASCEALQVQDFWVKPTSLQAFTSFAEQLRERWLSDEHAKE